MIDHLTVINLKADSKIRSGNGEVFVLKTCQRTLVLGFGQLPFYHLEDQNDIREMFTANHAYIFLLETICGLKSEVLAEYEIVGQFKDAYHNYSQLPFKKTNITSLLEKLFKDQKKIRTDHLREIGQLSYAGIARKLVHSKKCESDVLVIGSGSLSQDVIKLLKKKHKVFISARNSDKVQQLANEHSLEVIEWKNVDTYQKFDSIINTIGAHEILFDDAFFTNWKNSSLINDRDSKLFIDLGSPSVIKTELKEPDGVYRLEDIFRQSAQMNIEKMEKIRCAKDSIVKLCEIRRLNASLNHPFSWEELQFA